VTTYTTTPARFSRADQITPGNIVRLGGELCKVITPRILECCRTGRWFVDAQAFRGGQDAEPVMVEYVGPQWDPAVRDLVESYRRGE
jgi:hypothetical protein